MLLHNKATYQALVLILGLGIFSGCIRRDMLEHRSGLHEDKPEICIEMPQNAVVFEHLAPMVYEELWDHYYRAGYTMNESGAGVFTLRSKIRASDEIAKLVSPDVLTYGFKAYLELWCQLRDGDDKPVAERVFKIYQWVHKPKDPIMNTLYYKAQLRGLLRRAAAKIDYYFRRFSASKV